MPPDYGTHGRCTATARSTGEQCRQPATGPHGKCHFHGGASPTGRDSPHFKHGLFSDHFDDVDQEIVEVLKEIDDPAKLEALINWRLVRLRRAAKALNEGPDDATFWSAFEELVDATDDIAAEEIQELASLVDNGTRAVQDEIDTVRRLIKAHHAITDGTNITVSWPEHLSSNSSSDT